MTEFEKWKNGLTLEEVAEACEKSGARCLGVLCPVGPVNCVHPWYRHRAENHCKNQIMTFGMLDLDNCVQPWWRGIKDVGEISQQDKITLLQNQIKLLERETEQLKQQMSKPLTRLEEWQRSLTAEKAAEICRHVTCDYCPIYTDNCLISCCYEIALDYFKGED